MTKKYKGVHPPGEHDGNCRAGRVGYHGALRGRSSWHPRGVVKHQLIVLKDYFSWNRVCKFSLKVKKI